MRGADVAATRHPADQTAGTVEALLRDKPLRLLVPAIGKKRTLHSELIPTRF